MGGGDGGGGVVMVVVFEHILGPICVCAGCNYRGM